jgi:hypothetical protein
VCGFGLIFQKNVVNIQRINRPFAPAHSTWGTQRDMIGKRSLPGPIPAATVRRGDVPHVERLEGAGGSNLFTACGRRPPACPVKQT